MLRDVARVAAVVVLLSAQGHAAPGKPPPRKISGHLSWREHGPIAFAGGGYAVSLLMGPQVGGIALGRMQGLLKAVLQNPKAAGEKPGTKSVSMLAHNTFPRGALLGLSTHYSADVDFELEASDADPSAFVLKSGTVRWNALNENEFSAGGHALVDHFSDAGSEPLDPKTDSVRVTWNGADHSYTLEANIDHTIRVRGETSWSVKHEGTELFRFDVRYSDVQTLSGQSVGQPIPPETSSNPDQHRGFAYTVHGNLDDPSGTETWRDLVDNQVVAQHWLGRDCLLEITSPDAKQPKRKWIAKDDGAGKAVVEGDVTARILPSGLGPDVSWELPEIPGMKLEVEPSSRKGASLHVKYTGDLAASAFGDERYRVSAKLEHPVAGCEEQQTRVGLYFARSAKGNPSEKENGQQRPNYHYYWLKTAAGQGRDQTKTEYGGEKCRPGYLGYHPPFTTVVHLCDLGPENFKFTNLFTKRSVEGIDTFAEEVLHEWRHFDHEQEWTGQPDADKDGVPDAVEARWSSMGFRSDDRYSALKWATGTDQIDTYFHDEEVITFREMDGWTVGSANREDWACPGKQCKEGE